MNIPNDLNELLAQLKQITSETSRVNETSASGPRTGPDPIDVFLSHCNLDSETMIERIEITKDGEFEFYMFAASNPFTDDVSLLAMWP
jgi:hypothetical protein